MAALWTHNAVRRYRSVALTILVIALVLMLGVSFIVDPDSTVSDRTWGTVLLATGVASGAGLWCLATQRLTLRADQMLIATGLVAAVALAVYAMFEDFFFFVWVYGPLLVLAVLALWLGVINRGLQTELRWASESPGPLSI